MKYRKPLITPMTTEKKITGEIIGRVTWRNRWRGPAPSRSAASYRCLGTSSMAARKMIIDWPTIHIAIRARPGLAQAGSRNHSGSGRCRKPSTALTGPPGLSRNTNPRAAATSGTMVGRKKTVR